MIVSILMKQPEQPEQPEQQCTNQDPTGSTAVYDKSEYMQLCQKQKVRFISLLDRTALNDYMNDKETSTLLLPGKRKLETPTSTATTATTTTPSSSSSLPSSASGGAGAASATGAMDGTTIAMTTGLDAKRPRLADVARELDADVLDAKIRFTAYLDQRHQELHAFLDGASSNNINSNDSGATAAAPLSRHHRRAVIDANTKPTDEEIASLALYIQHDKAITADVLALERPLSTRQSVLQSKTKVQKRSGTMGRVVMVMVIDDALHCTVAIYIGDGDDHTTTKG
jgi:hypothetical protein